MFTVQYISYVCVRVLCCVMSCVLHLNWYLMLWRLKTWWKKTSNTTTLSFCLTRSFRSTRSHTFSLFFVYRCLCLAVVIYLFSLLHTLRSTMLHRKKKFFCPLYTKHLNTNSYTHKLTPKMLFIFNIQFVLFCFGFFLYCGRYYFALFLSFSMLLLLLLVLHDWTRARVRALASNYGKVVCASTIFNRNWMFIWIV